MSFRFVANMCIIHNVARKISAYHSILEEAVLKEQPVDVRRGV